MRASNPEPDVARGIMAVSGELHSDEEALLLDDGSRQQDVAVRSCERSEFCRLFFDDSVSPDSAAGLSRYFLQFAIAARRQAPSSAPTNSVNP